MPKGPHVMEPGVFIYTASTARDFSFPSSDTCNTHYPMKSGNIILIGAMGAGKSTVGRKLARRLGMTFYDSDRVIEEKTGVDIATIFEYEGEEGFRKREENAIAELCQLEAIVLATGGGVVLSRRNRDVLSATGTVFYLQATVDALFERVRNDSNRPLLKTPDRRRTLATLLQQREPLYMEAADHAVATGQHGTSWIADEIVRHLDCSPG